MTKKLFLIDAYALIYRSYFAFIKNPLINSKGFNTSPIMGFVRVLDDVIESEKPTHIAVAFDGNVRPFRFKIYDQYKAQREKTPEDILNAIPVIKQILTAYNIPILQLNNSEYDTEDQNYSYEADDIIGTIAKKAESQGFDVFMLTPDKDYAQLVSDHVKMYRPKKGGGYEIIGTESLMENWQVQTPEQIIDYLAILGDKVDNIPGCKGVGEKGVPKLLAEFGSVENLIANVDKLKGALKTKVEESIESMKLSKILARICVDAPVEFDEQEFLISNPDVNQLAKIYTEYELKSLLKKLVPEKPKKQDSQLSLFDELPINESGVEKYSNLSELSSTKHSYQLIDNEQQIAEFLTILASQKFFCFDTETTSIDTFAADLVGISFSWTESEAYFVRMAQSRVETQKIVDLFKPVFENPEIEKIGQNIKYDILMLSHYGVNVKGKLFDTLIAHYLLQPEQKHNMDYLAEIYLGYKTVTYEEMMGANKNIFDVDKNVLCDYAAEDADITLKLKNIFLPLLNENGLIDLFEKIEMPLVQVLTRMELNGQRVNPQTLSELSVSMNAQLIEIEKEIYQIAGYQFNISSPRQVGELIYEKLKLVENPKKTKTGQYSTTESILDSLRGQSPVIDKILDYRALKKLVSTYVDALPKLINKNTRNIHCSYNQAVTATGRLSSSDPNLQNIPVRDELGRDIRKSFVGEDGCVFLSADYSQIELRLMAHFSQDEALLSAFNSGLDVHSDTASRIFKVPIEEVTKDMRRKAKTANFGIIYGISAFGLSQRLGISRTEAKQIIDGYFESYPGVKKYMDNCIDEARQKGYVQTLLGRKRFLADINSRNANVRGFAERNAINAPIQGTAADIIKIAMVNIHNQFIEQNVKSKMTMQVHDELNFSVYQDEVEKVKQIVKTEMENAMKLSVPLTVECEVGENWLQAH